MVCLKNFYNGLNDLQIMWTPTTKPQPEQFPPADAFVSFIYIAIILVLRSLTCITCYETIGQYQLKIKEAIVRVKGRAPRGRI